MAKNRVLKIATIPDDWMPHCALSDLRNREECYTRLSLTPRILSSVLESANISYHLIPHPEHYYGKFMNNSYVDGILGSLSRGQIDMLSDTWFETEHRREHFQFTFPTCQIKLSFVTKLSEPGLESSAWLLFTVFGQQTWSCLFMSAFAMLIYLFLVLMVSGVTLKRTFDSSFKLVHVDMTAVKVVFCLLGFTAVLFGNLYQGTLLATLLTQPSTTAFSDIWQMVKLIEDGQLRLILFDKGDFRYEELMRSSRPFYKALRRATQENPVIFETNFTKAIKMVASGGYVYTTFSTQTGAAKLADCRITYIDGDQSIIPEVRAGFIMSKKTAWIPQLNMAVLRNQQRIENILDQYVVRTQKMAESVCKAEKQKPGLKPIDLLSLSGAALVFLIGSSLGTLAIACEQSWNYLQSRRKVQPVYDL